MTVENRLLLMNPTILRFFIGLFDRFFFFSVFGLRLGVEKRGGRVEKLIIILRFLDILVLFK